MTTFTLSDKIKIEYFNSGHQLADLEMAISRLLTECQDIFENDENAFNFLIHEEAV